MSAAAKANIGDLKKWKVVLEDWPNHLVRRCCWLPLQVYQLPNNSVRLGSAQFGGQSIRPEGVLDLQKPISPIHTTDTL